MSEELTEQLDCSSSTIDLTLYTVYKSKAVISAGKVENLLISNFVRDECIDLPPVCARECIPANASQIPKPKIACKWPHLKPIANEIAPFKPNVKVSLLIRNNVPRVVRRCEIISGGEDKPYAQRSPYLAGGIVGVVCQTAQRNKVVSNRLSVSCINSRMLTDTN